jgi:hypothetical protein
MQSVWTKENTPRLQFFYSSLETWQKVKYWLEYQWLKTGFGFVIGFINHLQVVTKNNYYTIADLHNLQSLHTNLLSLFPLYTTIRFLATDL